MSHLTLFPYQSFKQTAWKKHVDNLKFHSHQNKLFLKLNALILVHYVNYDVCMYTFCFSPFHFHP